MPHMEDAKRPVRVKTMEPGKLYTAYSPKGVKIRGTLEVVYGCAFVSCFTVGGNPAHPVDCHHDGETEMYWDGQETVTRRNMTVYVCEDGHEWLEGEIDFEEMEA